MEKCSRIETCTDRFNHFVKQSRNYLSDEQKMTTKDKLVKATPLMDQANWLLENCQDTKNFFDETLRWRHKVRCIYEK